MNIIVLVGCTSSGKDTILKELISSSNLNVKPIISFTSRPMRSGEVDGREYHFITKEDMLKKISNDEFIEVRSYDVAGSDVWYYGIGEDSICLTSEDTYATIVDISGLQEIKSYLEKHNKLNSLTSIFIDCSAQIRILRALQREGKLNDLQVAEICRRNLDDIDKVYNYKELCDYILKNETKDDLESNINFIKSLISNK